MREHGVNSVNFSSRLGCGTTTCSTRVALAAYISPHQLAHARITSTETERRRKICQSRHIMPPKYDTALSEGGHCCRRTFALFQLPLANRVIPRIFFGNFLTLRLALFLRDIPDSRKRIASNRDNEATFSNLILKCNSTDRWLRKIYLFVSV